MEQGSGISQAQRMPSLGGKKKKDKNQKPTPEVLGVRGGHYDLSSVFHVLFCFSPSSFSVNIVKNPKLAISYVVGFSSPFADLGVLLRCVLLCYLSRELHAGEQPQRSRSLARSGDLSALGHPAPGLPTGGGGVL